VISAISVISFLPVSCNYMKIFGILQISIHFAISDFIFVVISAISTVTSVISDRVYKISEVADPLVLGGRQVSMARPIYAPGAY